MRALGYLFTPFAALAWLLTVVIYGIAFLVPEARTATMPFYGGTVFQFFLDFSPIGLVVLIILNGLSGRWGPEGLRRVDLWSTRLGLLAMIIICLVVFVGGWGRADLPKDAIIVLFAVTGFALYDYFGNQGEQWRSSTLRAAAGAPAPARVAPASTPGAQHPFAFSRVLAALGEVRLGPYHNVYFVVGPDGSTSLDMPDYPALQFAPTLAAPAQLPAPAAASPIAPAQPTTPA